MKQELWEQAKDRYQKIEIPDELSFSIEQALFKGKKKKKIYRQIKHFTAIVAGFFLCFIIGVNSNTAFAGIMYEIPMLGTVAKLFTFSSYEEEREDSYLTVNIPEIKNTGNSVLEERINNEIRLKMKEVLQQAEQRAKDYREAYIETGGDPEKAWKMEIDIDYELKCSTPNYLSFVIWKSESLASSYSEQYYYNIDLQTGKELSLRDLLGPNYIEICNCIVKEEIKARRENGEDFFGNDKESEALAFQSIDENQTFYINQEGVVVLTFEKYSIAPGYMGIQEFEIIP